jgi:site-specific recombinase XerD
MKVKYRIKFYLEKRKDKESGEVITENMPIRLSFSYDGKRLEYYTGYRIDKTKWDVEARRAVINSFNNDGISANEINSRLSKIEFLLDDIIRDFKSKSVSPDVESMRSELKKKLDDEIVIKTGNKSFLDYFDDYIANKKNDFSPGFTKQMKSTRKHVMQFLGNKQMTLDNINYSFFEGFKKYYIEEKENSSNSFAGAVKRIHFFLNYAVDNNWTNNTQYKKYKASESYQDPIFLEWDELKLLYKKKFKNKCFEQVRDVFVFQSLIGCRFEDLHSFSKTNIYKNTISYIAEKTNTPIEIPLNTITKGIINKYVNVKSEQLLPVISNQKYNEYLKEVGEKAGLKRKVEKIDKDGKKIHVPIYELMSSHMARRNFIGNAINEFDIRTEVIQSITGHAKNSKAFARYYKINSKAKVKALSLMKIK